jgi:hypothetical protein
MSWRTRNRSPGAHEDFVRPLWKQGIGSTVHCVAGDATGIILAAAITALIGFPMWADVLVEYAAGFLFGLLIFQSLFMRRMMGGSYAENVRRSFIPELLSMNCMIGGNGARHDRSHDGPRHAGNVARRATLLVRHVSRRAGGIRRCVPGERLAGGEGDEARTDDRPR